MNEQAKENIMGTIRKSFCSILLLSIVNNKRKEQRTWKP